MTAARRSSPRATDGRGREDRPPLIDPWGHIDRARNTRGNGPYQKRLHDVVTGQVVACGERGPRDHADCVLQPGHADDHYGSGYDTWGPKGPYGWSASESAAAVPVEPQPEDETNR